jgi:hypothetical protein
MKINGIETKAREFAFDGCHKIYLIESEQDRGEARDSGYDILPISSLRKSFNNSCGLQFISSWDLSVRYCNQFQKLSIEP